jgi:hypothetical protein
MASRLGYSAQVTDDGLVVWWDEFALGSSLIPLIVVAASQGADIVIEVGCPIIDWDPHRLEIVEVVSPLLGLWVEAGEGLEVAQTPEGDEPADPDIWLVASGTSECGQGPDGLRQCRTTAISLFSVLARSGVIQVIDAGQEDAALSDAAAALPELKAERPKEALDAALWIAARCRNLGDFTTAAFFDLAAGEVATALGQARRAWELAQPAWSVLGKPLDDSVLVGIYAAAITDVGSRQKAFDLMVQAQAEAPDPGAAALLQGNCGVLLAKWGRPAEAIPLLEASIQEPSLADEHRRVFQVTLADARRSIGGDEPGPPAESRDTIDEADENLNEIASMLMLAENPFDLVEQMAEIEARVKSIRAMWEHLGPGQQIRVLMTEAILEFSRGGPDVAARKLRTAALVAEETGNVELIRWVRTLALSMPGTARGLAPAREPLTELTPLERLMMSFNRAYYLMTSVGKDQEADVQATMEDSLAATLESVRIVESQRQQFSNIADRKSWASLGRRAHEFAFALAIRLVRPSLTVELLERVRAQGLPSASTMPESAEGMDEGQVPTRDLGLAAPAPPTLHAVLGDLVVDSPHIATVTGSSEIEPTRPAFRLDEIVAAVAGEEAWWWSCQTFADRLYWAVRSPDGRISIGSKDQGREGALGPQQVAALFKTPATPDDWADHLLIGDLSGRRESTLRELADLLLPSPLADAARSAARVGIPIRVVWAPPPALGSLPVGLLPLGDGHRLLHGAIFTTAPPTSLMTVLGPIGNAGMPEPRSETVILGETLREGIADAIVSADGLGVPASDVLGSVSHVLADPPLAASLATPQAVLQSWATPSPSLSLYYGHVDERPASSILSTSLRLTDGQGDVPLDVGQLLVGKRMGAPDVVVLCGCSSLNPSSIGSGEWWGFGVALLWQGSRQVVGSVWKLIDCRATARFAVELVSRLRSGVDPVLVLHRLQLEWLEDWERRVDEPFSGSTSDRHPILWAGWSVTGVRGTSR